MSDAGGGLHRRHRRPGRRRQEHGEPPAWPSGSASPWSTPARSTAPSPSPRRAPASPSTTTTAWASCSRSLPIEFAPRAGRGAGRSSSGTRTSRTAIRTPAISLGASAVSARPVVRAGCSSCSAASPSGAPGGRGARGPGHRHRGLSRRRREVLPHRRGPRCAPSAGTRSSLAKGQTVTLDAGARRSAEARQGRHRSAPIAPLKPADDSVVVDSTPLSKDEVVDQIVAEVEAAGGGAALRRG